MRLNNYYDKQILLEKVSKKEIDEALRNENILIGCEFEFIMDNFGEHGGSNYNSEEYDSAYDDWVTFDREVDKAKRQYDRLQQKLGKLQDNVNKLQDEVDAAESDLQDVENEQVDKEAEIEGFSGSDTELKKLQNELKKIEAKVKKESTRVDILNSKLSDKQEEFEDLQDNYLDMIDFPSMGQDYIRYMSDFGYNVDSIDSVMIVLEDSEMPEEPTETENVDNTIESIETHVRESGMLKDIPFKHYEFGEYGTVKQRVGDTLWAIETDSSLSDGGVEIKSPPMPLPDFMKIFPNLIKWIQKHGYTDATTGMHAHMSIKGVKDLSDKLNTLKMIMFLDEGYIWNAFSDRVDNFYVKSAKDKLKENGVLPEKISKQVFDYRKIAVALSTEHADAINLQSVREGHVEYRYLGGTDYDRKEKQITASLGHFAYNLSIGYDPNFKHKEYILKLERVFNKMELWELDYKIQGINIGLDPKANATVSQIPDIDMKIINKTLKEWMRKRDLLSKVYKIDNKTDSLLRKNKAYKDSVIASFKKEFKSLLSPKGYSSFVMI